MMFSYALCSSDECVVYHTGSNSLISRGRSSLVAEDYFEQFMIFSETDTDTILDAFHIYEKFHFLPMQPVKLQHEREPQQRMAVFYHPLGTKLGVMNLYSETFILSTLGIPYLAEGTHLELRTTEGKILMQYPRAVTEEVEESSYLLSSQANKPGIEVSVWIPHSYFSDLLRPVQSAGILAILIVMLLGLALALVFSKASVRPLRRLIDSHGEEIDPQPVNELLRLDSLLLSAHQKAEQIQFMLNRQLLARALSGSILSEQDEAQLDGLLNSLCADYRVAIVHTEEDLNTVLGEFLPAAMPDTPWAMISKNETGLILDGKGEQVELLKNQLEEMRQLNQGVVLCGISAQATELRSLHKAVRQARAAIPKESGVKLFPDRNISSLSVPWLLHERLSQNIFGGSEEAAFRHLNEIAAQTNPYNARETFYNVRFVMRSAAEEMDLPLPVTLGQDYSAAIPPHDNILALAPVLQELFALVKEKNEGGADQEHLKMLEYIQDSMADTELCAASVAEHFGVSEQTVYKKIRKLTGMSFNAYLTSLRMKRAAELLVSTELSAAEIKSRCGYEILGTFYRRFREYYKTSPGAYREQHRQE